MEGETVRKLLTFRMVSVSRSRYNSTPNNSKMVQDISLVTVADY